MSAYTPRRRTLPHHYRDSDGLEVDIIVESRDGTWGAFEVKLGPGQVDRAAASLLSFAAKVDTVKVGEPAVLGGDHRRRLRLHQARRRGRHPDRRAGPLTDRQPALATRDARSHLL